MERIGDNEKQVIWDSCARAIDRTVDRLEMHIDEGIRETLIALKVNGFGTLASCEGHVDRGLPYPWVDVGSSLAEENSVIGSRFVELKKAALVERQGGEKMSDSDKAEFEEKLESEQRQNHEACMKLLALLNEYFESNDIDNPTLVIEKGPRSTGRLRPANVIEGNIRHIKEELARMSKEEIVGNLNKYRGDMDDFASFLKGRFLCLKKF